MNDVERFVTDYLMVVENDYIGWNQHLAYAKASNMNQSDLADMLRNDWEEFIMDSCQKLDSTGEAYRVNILREMMLGWTQPFDAIANIIIKMYHEG